MGTKCILGVVLIAFPGLLVRESPFHIFLRIFLYELSTGTFATGQCWQWLTDTRVRRASQFLRVKAGGRAFQNGPRPLSKVTFTVPSVDSLIVATFLVERTWALESDRPSSNPRRGTCDYMQISTPLEAPVSSGVGRKWSPLIWLGEKWMEHELKLHFFPLPSTSNVRQWTE